MRVKFSKLIMGCMAALGLSAGVAVAQEDAEHAAIAERLAPVGELCVQGEDCGTGSASAVASADSAGAGAAGVSGEDIDAEAIYNSLCMACHATGAAGAPIRGDEAAWADRVTQGFDTLLDHSINGFNAMPARGGNPNLTDAEMLAATKYMLEPVMDVPADVASAADDASSDEAAASDDGASPAEEAQVAAADSDAADEAPQAAAQDAAAETAGADLPGAGKIGVCVACHGQDGHGTAPIYPNLAGQNAEYMVNAMKAYRAGEREGGMSMVMTPMAAGLSDEDIVDLAEYYSQQTP